MSADQMAMGTAFRSIAHGRRTERGAALVEFALIAPVLLLFLLGTYTAGVTYNRNLSIANAVREGGRYGATLSISSFTSCSNTEKLNCWLPAIADVVEQNATGDLSSTASGKSICVAFVSPYTTTGDRTYKLVRTSSGDTVTPDQSCFTDGRTDRRVQVTASRTSTIEGGIVSYNPTLTAKSVTRYEAAKGS